jgi:hypothetical protein
MKIVVLTNENYGTLVKVVDFALKELGETDGDIGGKKLVDVFNLDSAIDFCTKDGPELEMLNCSTHGKPMFDMSNNWTPTYHYNHEGDDPETPPVVTRERFRGDVHL